MLQQIFEAKKEEVAAAKRKDSLIDLKNRSQEIQLENAFLRAVSPNCGSDPLNHANPARGPKLIAEIKKASPSQGLIRADFDPAQIASIYAKAGANALSVLTDEKYFQGHALNIAIAKSACSLPVLRKDFIASEYQVYESKVLGADAILLIVAGLEMDLLRDLHALAVEIGLDVLVEVHSESELENAVDISPKIIGVNNRDLATFQVDLAVSERLIPTFPPGIISVCESALASADDVARADRAGANALLIGTAFCSSPDIENKIREMMQW